ncbi:Cytochrome c oxidase subunit 3 [Bienertia sinuspersici]
MTQRHSFHLTDPSPWLILGSLRALAMTVGGVMYMHSFQGGAKLLSFGLIFLLYTMFVRWCDVLCKSTLEGLYTKVAFSHSFLAPAIEIEGIWVLYPREIPFLNTLILLSSGAAITWLIMLYSW